MFGNLILFLLVISAEVISLTGKTGINYIPDWSSGESFEFNITRIKDIKEPGKPVSSDTVQYTAFFKVIEDAGDKYRIKWRFKTDFSASFKIPPEIASQLEEYTNTEIIYTANKKGKFIEIENWRDLRRLKSDFYSKVAELFHKNYQIDTNELKNVFDTLLEPFNSQESIEYNAFLEIPSLHLPFGQSYTEPDVNSSQTLQPDTLKSSFLIRDHFLFVEKIDFENNIIEAYEIINYEPDKIKEDKKRQLRNNYESDEQLEEGMKDIQYEKKERINYSLKINPRIPEKVKYEYENIMNMKGVQLYKFERITVELINYH